LTRQPIVSTDLRYTSERDEELVRIVEDPILLGCDDSRGHERV
jgi:hypothetical protein